MDNNAQFSILNAQFSILNSQCSIILAVCVIKHKALNRSFILVGGQIFIIIN